MRKASSQRNIKKKSGIMVAVSAVGGQTIHASFILRMTKTHLSHQHTFSNNYSEEGEEDLDDRLADFRRQRFPPTPGQVASCGRSRASRPPQSHICSVMFCLHWRASAFLKDTCIIWRLEIRITGDIFLEEECNSSRLSRYFNVFLGKIARRIQ